MGIVPGAGGPGEGVRNSARRQRSSNSPACGDRSEVRHFDGHPEVGADSPSLSPARPQDSRSHCRTASESVPPREGDMH